MTLSVFESIDDVGSSRIRIGASLMNARATQMRWRSPPGEPAPFSPTYRLVRLRQTLDEVVRVGRLRSLDDLVHGGVELAVADVLLDRPREEQWLLEDDADLLAERGELDLAQVAAVEQHAARFRVVEAGDQADERRLAGAGRTDDRDARSRPARGS